MKERWEMEQEVKTIIPPIQVGTTTTNKAIVYWDPETNSYYGKVTGPWRLSSIIPKSDLIPLLEEPEEDYLPF